jgi:hypothetical protein
MLESGLLNMKQASLFLAGLDQLRQSFDAGDLVCAAWKKAVGKKVAEHTRASKLVRNTLVVEVEDWLWQRNLMGLSRQIMRNIDNVVGPGIVSELEFRVLPPRRGPRVAQASMPALKLPGDAVADEASSIADPGLRRIYCTQRRKEIA